jgi:hypothetical protein
MLGWVSTVWHSVSWPVRYLERTLRARTPVAAHPSDLTPEQGRASAQQTASGSTNDSTVPEWQTDAWKHRVEGEARKHLDSEIDSWGRPAPLLVTPVSPAGALSSSSV